MDNNIELGDNVEFNRQKESVENKWNEIKILIESLEIDYLKLHKNNKSAATRFRQGLRLVRTKSNNLVKASLEYSRHF